MPDEFEWKWGVKAGNGRDAIEGNQDAGAFEGARRGGNQREREIYSCFGFGLSEELKPGLHPAG